MSKGSHKSPSQFSKRTPQSHVITLIHGTFATNAAWTRTDSALSKKLKISLSEPVILEPFQWSGRNSHAERLEAGRGLVEHILQLDEKYPNSKHYIVAHSHGGNVALYALRNNEVQERVKAVICLATPFIQITPRDIEPSVKIIAGVPAGLAAIGSVVLWLTLTFWAEDLSILDFNNLGWQSLLTPFWAIATYLVPAFTFIGVFFLVAGAITKPLQKKQDVLLKKLLLPKFNRKKVFALRFASDEARRYLNVITDLGNIPFRIFQLSYILVVWLVNAAEWVSERIPVYIFFAFIPAAVLSIAMIPLWMVMAVMHLLLRGHAGGFGEELLEGMLLRVNVSNLPPDLTKAGNIEYNVKGRDKGVGDKLNTNNRGQHRLLHSLIYEDTKVVDDVVKIIQKISGKPNE